MDGGGGGGRVRGLNSPSLFSWCVKISKSLFPDTSKRSLLKFLLQYLWNLLLKFIFANKIQKKCMKKLELKIQSDFDYISLQKWSMMAKI